MKPIEINEENFESLLAYDDLFLDYFNAFLQYPAFPQPLYYNRLTGSFQEVEDDSGQYSPQDAVHRDPRRMSYGPGDAERERIMDWAKRKRLPLFLRTRLFLEYKLCKLLVRPLEDRLSTSRQSTFGLRGYSRETTSYSTTSMSLAQSHEASEYDNDSDYSWPGDTDRHVLFKHMRPGSRCISMPAMLGLTINGSLWSPLGASYPNQQLPGKAPSPNKSSREKLVNGKVSSRGEDKSSRQDDMEREETTLTLASKKAGKSALRSGSGKENSTKKRATIQTPVESANQRKTVENNERTLHRESPSQESEEESESEDTCSSDEEDVEGDEEESFTEQKEEMKSTSSEERIVPLNDRVGSGVARDGNAGADFLNDALAELEIQVNEARDPEAEHSIIHGEDAEEILEEYKETESVMRQVEAKHRVTFHQLKEEILGSLIGMELFKVFLAGTIGEDMLNFWLDCEMYRDNVQVLEDGADITRTRLFRDIQDKYRFKLTPDAQKQIKQAQGNIGLSDSVFTRTQYDILRRLRSYWVARFLIHQEKSGEYSYERLRERHQRILEEAKKPVDTFLPSISFVNSLPVRPSSCFRLATTQNDWSLVAHGGRQMEDSIQPGLLMTMDETKYIPRPMSARFHVGLSSDKDAGRPFQNYLERHTDHQLLAYLLFWQDVSDYVIAEDRSADRLLLMAHAWSIFNKYIMDGGIWNIDLPQGERDFIHTNLLQTSDLVQASIFDRAKEHAVKMLQREWLYYLKEDLKTFLDCRGRIEDRIMSASSHKSFYSERTAASRRESVLTQLDGEEAKVVVTEKKSKKGGQKGKDGKLGTDESQADKEAIKKLNKERKKKQIALQRKLVRQARARQMEAKKGNKTTKKQGVKFEGKESKDGGRGPVDDGAGGDEKGDRKYDEEKEATFKKTYRNKSTMTLFKTFVADFEAKETSNILQMFFDIDIFWHIPENQVDKRLNIAKQIFTNYFDPNSKKSVTSSLSRELMVRQNNEGDRPTNKTLDMAQKCVMPLIEDAFANFWAAHMESEDQGGDRADGMTNTGRTESTQSMVLAYKRRRRGKGPLSGQQMPSGLDKNEFHTILIKSARGSVSHKLMTFHRYLMEYNEKDGGSQYLDKDLIFYLEAQRFKEACHANADINLLKKKVEVILDCFIDSPLSTSGVQIDIPTENANRIVKKADVFLKDTGKDPHNPNFFDDPQYTVFKEMLPYWAAFNKRYQPPAPQSHDKHDASKYERLSKQRLRLFMDMKEPNTAYKLPAINTPPQNRTGGTGITFSICEGLQWKAHELSDVGNDLASEVGSLPPHRSERSSTRDSSITPGAMQHKYRNSLPTRTNGLPSNDPTSLRPNRTSAASKFSDIIPE